MARIYPLFSSSKGNSSFIGNSDGGILVDAGVSCKRLCEALKANEIDPAVIQGIFITHTHSDHVSGLKVLTKKYHIPVFAQKTNLEILVSDGKIDPACDVNEVDGNEVCIGDYFILSGADKPVEPRTMQYRYKKILQSAEVENHNYHKLRHTFATNSAENGFNVKALSAVLGHSSVTLTLNRYIHPDRTYERRLMNMCMKL